MTNVQIVFLSLISAGLNVKVIDPPPVLDADGWDEVRRLAINHELIGIICDSANNYDSFNTIEAGVIRQFRSNSVDKAVRQIIQENEFLTLVLHMQASGIDPVVIKGAVVRSLYPKPMLRPSVDEDILVSPEQMEAVHRFLLSQGLTCDDPEADPTQAAEMSYHKPDSPTYIEVHTCLIPPENAAYGALNAFFDGVLDRTTTVRVQDVTLRTLSPTDHVLYLLCHAYKHFLHAGVGIRQVCDLGMMAREYDSQIDWPHILACCRQVRMERFAAGLLRIGEKHLGFEMPEAFASVSVDEADLLEDILTGGLYGVEDINRAHTAAITLDAVAAQRQGRRASGLLAAAFPNRRSMEGRYPYLKEKPWLLPVAWGQRILRYLTHRDRSAPGTPSESLRIGAERVALLKEYGIID